VIDLNIIQQEQKIWADRNFGSDFPDGNNPLIGVGEETGELAEALGAALSTLRVVGALGQLDHAFLKRKQGIRGTRAEHNAAIKDAVGDICIYLMDFCTREGLQLADCINDAWEQVKYRDWLKHRQDGVSA
jgi:NTP pyrophosphatase (non-canonical NTP hydrolase)